MQKEINKFKICNLELFLPLILSLSIAPITANAASRQVLSCNSPVTTSVTLSDNIYCPGGTGLVVAADGITINLNGKFIKSDDTSPSVGIVIDGRRNVTLTNGNVSDFEVGVLINNSSNINVSRLSAVSNVSDGIRISGNSTAVTLTNVSANLNGTGIRSDNDSSLSFKTVEASENQSAGLFLTSPTNLFISGVSAKGNGGQGINIDSAKGSVSITQSTFDGRSMFYGNSVRSVNGLVLNCDNSIATVQSNTIVYHAYDGVVIRNCGLQSDLTKYSLISNNRSDNNFSSGFLFENNVGALYSGNFAESNNGSGFVFILSRAITVKSNTSKNNNGNGFDAQQDSLNRIVLGSSNVSTNNFGYGYYSPLFVTGSGNTSTGNNSGCFNWSCRK